MAGTDLVPMVVVKQNQPPMVGCETEPASTLGEMSINWTMVSIFPF